MEYNYSPLLKHPEKMPDIDPLNPGMRLILKITVKTEQAKAASFNAPEGCTIRDTSVTSSDGTKIPIRIAEPADCTEELPGILMIHGGAFYLPVSASALALACQYALRLNARVYIPEYRLVPAFSAPKALEDCMAVWETMCREYGNETGRLLIIGDSAGAAITESICFILRDQKKNMPAGQLLIYPVADTNTEQYPSAVKYPDAVWSVPAAKHMWSGYLHGTDPKLIPTLVPLANSDYTNLPAAYIEPQEIDALCDEGIALAKKLEEAGVPVELSVIPASYHGFDSDLSSPLVQAAVERRVHAMERMLGI